MNKNLFHMARAGKTFFFASLWLPQEVREDAAIAYSFCRAVDDIADETVGGGGPALADILSAIEQRNPTSPQVAGVLALIQRYPSVEASLLELVRACARDGAGVTIANEEELLKYCQGVAGTVGLVMYPILGGTDEAGRASAEALGMAMQCTNIARDVLADSQRGRCYLPTAWLGGVDPADLARGDERCEREVVAAVARLLELAASQYRFGLEGLEFLRADCRRGIEIAARCYEGIGARAIEQGRLSRVRAVVPLVRKMQIAARVYLTSQASPRRVFAFSK